MKVSIIIPALNEEKSIGSTIDSIPVEELSKKGYTVEVIVVDGGSSDKTAEIAWQKGAKVVVEKRKGYGRAYRTGFEMATGDIILTADADNTYPLKEIPKFIEIITKRGLDFIITNRFHDYEPGAWSPINLVGNKLINLAIRILFRINLVDSQSGMWIFRKSVLDKLSLDEDGMSFSSEIKIKVAEKGFRMGVVPISYKRRVLGSSSKLNWLRHGFEIFIFLILHRLNLK